MTQTPIDITRLGQNFQDALANSAWSEALDLVDQLIAALPDNSSLLYNKGLVLKRLGRAANSIPYFENALSLQADHHNARFELGGALLETGHPEESVRAFEQYLSAMPDDVDGALNLGIALVQVGHANDALARLQYAHEQLGSSLTIQWLATAQRDVGALDIAEELLASLPLNDVDTQVARLKIQTQGSKGRFSLKVN